MRTIPPDTIRYGRSPSSPAPPQPVPPSVDHRSAAVWRRSWGERLQNRTRQKESTAIGDTEKAGRSGKLTANTASSCGGSSRGVGRRRESLRGEEDEGQRFNEGSDASDYHHDDPGRWYCPPLAWDELEPWEQRHPRTPWMMPSSRGGVGNRGRGEMRNEVAIRKGALAASNDKVRKITLVRRERERGEGWPRVTGGWRGLQRRRLFPTTDIKKDHILDREKGNEWKGRRCYAVNPP